MGIELVINVVLFLGAIFCFWSVGNGISPSPIPGVMSAADWPRLILAGLMIALAVNIHSLAKVRSDPTAQKEIPLKELCTPKFLTATGSLIAYALTVEYIGFLATTAIFVMIFSYIIGLRNKVSIVVGGLVTSVCIYIIFQLGLQVMLPRGLGIFRQFGLWLEIITT